MPSSSLQHFRTWRRFLDHFVGQCHPWSSYATRFINSWHWFIFWITATSPTPDRVIHCNDQVKMSVTPVGGFPSLLQYHRPNIWLRLHRKGGFKSHRTHMHEMSWLFCCCYLFFDQKWSAEPVNRSQVRLLVRRYNLSIHVHIYLKSCRNVIHLPLKRDEIINHLIRLDKSARWFDKSWRPGLCFSPGNGRRTFPENANSVYFIPFMKHVLFKNKNENKGFVWRAERRTEKISWTTLAVAALSQINCFRRQ